METVPFKIIRVLLGLHQPYGSLTVPCTDTIPIRLFSVVFVTSLTPALRQAGFTLRTCLRRLLFYRVFCQTAYANLTDHLRGLTDTTPFQDFFRLVWDITYARLAATLLYLTDVLTPHTFFV